jgi:hypothetical protein
MKKILSAFLIMWGVTLFAQVEIDRKIQMTGAAPDAKIEGIQTVVNPTDAVNKAYVDDAISAAVGTPVTMDFSLSGNPSSILMGQGTSSSSTPVNLIATFQNGAGAPVSLSVSGLPSGVSHSLSPSGGFPTFSSMLIFTASPSVTPGVYPLTVTAQGGGDTETFPLTLTVAAAKKVFVTSTVQNGNLGGLSGGDAICNARAQAAGLPGTYAAWLSTNSVQARNRINDGLFARTDGQLVALSKTDLTDGSISNPINRDEFGNIPGGETQVFTGTGSDGNKWVFSSFPSIDYSCIGWTSSSNPYDHTGEMGASNSSWTDTSAGQGCANARRLYCFQL